MQATDAKSALPGTTRNNEIRKYEQHFPLTRKRDDSPAFCQFIFEKDHLARSSTFLRPILGDMATRLFCAVSFAAVVAAQSSTTVSLLFPNADQQASLVGSVVGSDATATTYVVGCAGSASSAAAMPTSPGNSSYGGGSDYGCGFDGSQTVTQGPSTYHWVATETEIGGTITLDCVLSGTTQAVCAETASGSALTASPSVASTGDDGGYGGVPPLTTVTLTGTDLPPFQQVVITAGLSNLKAAGGASSTGSAASKSTGSGSPTSGGGSSTASSSGATTKSSSGALIREPALVMGAAGMLAVGLAAVAL